VLCSRCFSVVSVVSSGPAVSARKVVACCAQRRFMENRHFLGVVGFVSPAFIWVFSGSVRLNMPTVQILGPPFTSVLPALKPFGPKGMMTRRWSPVPRRSQIVSRDSTLVLPLVLDRDRYEAYSVQLETVRLTVVCTIDLMKTLLDTAHKLSEDAAVLKTDNASLKSQINKLHEKSGQPQGSLLYIVSLQVDKEIDGTSKVALCRSCKFWIKLLHLRRIYWSPT
jgi:hypothetical protein